MRRPTANIAPAERVARAAIGVREAEAQQALAAMVVGFLLLWSAEGLQIRVLEALLVLAGIDLVVTGASGHCPLYRRLGPVPRSLGRRA